jgi:hypothetical protein
MGIGAGMAMIGVGAILAFGPDVHVGGLELSSAGWMVMASGLLALAMTTLLLRNRQNPVRPRPPVRPVPPRSLDDTVDLTLPDIW